jgi:hypothetical protein
MQAASRFREDGMENPADGMLGGATRGHESRLSSLRHYPYQGHQGHELSLEY